MKYIRIVLLGVCLMTVTQGWSQKIGFLMDSYVIDRWYTDQKLFVDKVHELGGECIVEVPHGDPDEQLKLGKKLIANGVDVLVIIPCDGHKAAAIVAAAKEANVPVVSYDRLISSNDISYYVSYDNDKVGKLQAQYAKEKVPSGNYLLINGPVSDNNSLAFKAGQMSVLKPDVESKKIKIVGDYVLDGWSELEALMRVDEFFSAGKAKLDVIIAANDAIASGAIQSLPKELVGKVIITGQDADQAALKNIIAGNQSMTIYKPIKPLAFTAAEVAMKLAKKDNNIKSTKVKIGDTEANAILLEPVVVDKKNYKETVVKDGHAKLSEILRK